MPTPTALIAADELWRDFDDRDAHQARLAAELAADLSDLDTADW